MRDRTDKALPPPSSPWIQLLFPVDLRQQETRGHLRRCWWREGRQMGTTSGSCSRMVSSSKRSLRSFTLGLCKRGHMRRSRRATIVAMVCSCNFNWHNGLDYQPMALYCLCRRGSLGLPLTLPLLQRPPSVALAALWVR